MTATQTISLLPVGFSTASASCPAGTFALSGGYTFSSNILPALVPADSSDAPVGGSSSTGPTGWAITYPVTVGLSALLGASVTVYAVCSGPST